MKRFGLFYVAPAMLLLALAVLPIISGEETLYVRDVLTSHYPLKSAQAELLRRGELPLVDPLRAGGQPLLGNPNALPLYPDNLLYLVASPLWAMNAHFWLHLLLAPAAVFWLGRAWGLSRPAAWAAGVCYAASGFFLSLLNLYNLVAGAVLAPALVAACLDAWSPDARRRGLKLAVVGFLWGLLLLAGDPLFAALALVLAAGACLGRRRAWRRAAAGTLLALAGGTLLAAPMLVEMARILPLSYRGYWQYSLAAALAQSWDPRSAVEWLLPFFFGRPDFSFWGTRFYGGNPPLFYSLYPGLLSLALVVVAGRPRTAAARWAWIAVGAGIFFALGAWNPVVRALYVLPGAAALRFPVKLWLLVAVGGALLCGLGFERLLAGGRRRLLRVLGGLAVFFALVWGLLRTMPANLAGALGRLDPERLAGPLLEREVARWSAQSFLSLATLGLLAAALIAFRRRPYLGGAVALAVHLVAQGFFLRPLIDTDAAALYEAPPPALAAVPADAVVVHGGFRDLFGRQRVSSADEFPDPRFLWLARRQYRELHPFAGVRWGRRYELNHSPEGLDSFFSISFARALQRASDLERVRLLEAIGVDTLILDRALAPAARAAVNPRAEPEPGLFIYALPRAGGPRLVGTVLRAPRMNDALAILAGPEFDPRTMVVLPGDGPARRGAPGTVRVVEESVERLDVEVEAPDPGALVTRRSFLAPYRATIDGAPAETRVANLVRLAVEVPAGRHRVRIWLDRRPTRVAWAGAALGVVGLGLLAAGRLRATAPGKERLRG